MQDEYVLNQLKEKGIMAAIVGRDGTQVASNFTMNEGLESYISSSFNMGNALLEESGEEAEEIVVSTDTGNILLKKTESGILVSLVKTKEQYAFYKKITGSQGKEENNG